ncbi:MAG: DUF6503 family protein [Bacteroidota bacterium]
MRLKFILICFSITFSKTSDAQSINGQTLLEKSIDYHDPKGNWDSFDGMLQLTETRPNGVDRNTTLKLDNGKSYFYLDQNREGFRLEKIIEAGNCKHRVNNSEVVADSLVQKFRLTCPQLQRIRDYYVYLWGMPMKLRDKGTQIHEKVETSTFMGKAVLSMKVTYDKVVGEDIWYFYFNPDNYALVGYRFFHDETANDGEYIPLEGEEIIQGIRFPKTRTWYVNKDDRLLGSDILEAQ